MASLISSETMIKALILFLIAQGNFSFSLSLVHDINAFKNNMYTTDQQQCQSVIGRAWQCWARFGKNYPMCSDIIRSAWQCSGQGFKIDIQALDIDSIVSVFPKRSASMQTEIGGNKKVNAMIM